MRINTWLIELLLTVHYNKLCGWLQVILTEEDSGQYGKQPLQDKSHDNSNYPFNLDLDLVLGGVPRKVRSLGLWVGTNKFSQSVE